MILDNSSYPIVITAGIANFEVKRILIDDGSAIEILSYNAFKEMRLREEDLSQARTLIK